MRFASLMVAVALVQAGQVKNQVPPKTVPTIRIYNAIQSGPDVKLDILLDGSPVASAVAADTLSGPFMPKDPKNVKLAIKKAEGTDSLLELPVDASSQDHILVVLGDPDKKLDVADLPVKAVLATVGKSSINILSVIPKDDAGDDIDVYVLGPADKLETATPAAKAVAYKSSTSIYVPPGVYTVVVTKTGVKDTLVQSGPIDAKENAREAVLALPKISGKPNKVQLINL